jgi:hypothetical protein
LAGPVLNGADEGSGFVEVFSDLLVCIHVCVRPFRRDLEGTAVGLNAADATLGN